MTDETDPRHRVDAGGRGMVTDAAPASLCDRCGWRGPFPRATGVCPKCGAGMDIGNLTHDPAPSAAAADPAEASAEAVALVDALCLSWQGGNATQDAARARVLAHVAAVERRAKEAEEAMAERIFATGVLDPNDGDVDSADPADRIVIAAHRMVQARVKEALVAERARGEALREEREALLHGRVWATGDGLWYTSATGDRAFCSYREAMDALSAARPSAPPPEGA